MDFKEFCQRSHEIAQEHGFWEDGHNPLTVPTKIVLIITELSEALEAHRTNDYKQAREEIADTLIRLADLIAWWYPRTALDEFIEVLEAKMAYNETRPHKHNKRY